MITKNFKLRKSYIASLAFTAIYILDVFSYGVLSKLNLPIGSIGILLAFILIPFYISENGYGFNKRIGVAIALLLPILLTYYSGKGNTIEIYFWFKALGFFVIGYYFFNWLYQHESKLEVIITISAFVLLCFIFIFTDPNKGKNYLRVSDGFMFLSFLAISSVRSKTIFVLTAIISSLALYHIGSRFALAAYSTAVFFLFFSRLNLTSKLSFSILSIPTVLIGYWQLYNAYLRVDNIHSNRLLRLLFESNNDTSLQARNYMFENSVNVFKQNFIFGDYKYYLDQDTPGAFAHNFMSFWSELGILGIVISFYFIYLSIKTLIISYRKVKDENRLYSFLFLISICQILGLLFSQSHYWMSLYFIAGMCFSFLLENKLTSRSKSSIKSNTS